MSGANEWSDWQGTFSGMGRGAWTITVPNARLCARFSSVFGLNCHCLVSTLILSIRFLFSPMKAYNF